MSMSMSLSCRIIPAQRMETRLEQRLEQRMQLEQRLQQRLAQQLALKMTLEQYLYQEKLIQGLIRWTDENNRWVNFNRAGFNFKFANVPYEIAQPIADKAGPGFAHCHYNPFEGRATGDWTLFVVGDMYKNMQGIVPEIALHERGEELSLGNHYFASQLEFAHITKNRKTAPYVRFVDNRYPTKFIDLTQEVHFPILPEELLEVLTKRGKRNEEELGRAEELIKENPLPTSVLRKVIEYGEISDKVCRTIRGSVGPCQKRIFDMLMIELSSPTECAKAAHEILYNAMSRIKPEEARVVSLIATQQELQHLSSSISEQVAKERRRNLVVSTQFSELYRKMQEGKKLVRVSYTIEDKAMGKIQPEWADEN